MFFQMPDARREVQLHRPASMPQWRDTERPRRRGGDLRCEPSETGRMQKRRTRSVFQKCPVDDPCRKRQLLDQGSLEGRTLALLLKDHGKIQQPGNNCLT